jgi:hypothetical protein
MTILLVFCVLPTQAWKLCLIGDWVGLLERHWIGDAQEEKLGSLPYTSNSVLPIMCPDGAKFSDTSDYIGIEKVKLSLCLTD